MARIMIVEDEAIVAAELKQKLEDLNHQVVAIVSRGKEAISTANKLRPDLILMDIVLKGKINGIESVKQIQKNLDVPIIYVTAYADKKTLEQAKTTTPFGYIIKPFQTEHIRSTVEIALYKHRMDQKLKENEAWFRILFDFAPDAYYLNNLEGIFIDGNKAAEKLLGYRKKELIGKNLKEIGLLLPCYLSKEIENLGKNKNMKPTGPDEFVLNKKDGKTVNVEVKTYPVTINNEILILGIARDVTERKKSEEALLELNQKLEKRNREIEQLTSISSHNLQTPMRMISSYVDLFAKRYKNKLDKEADEFIDYIKDGSYQLKSIIDDLLVYTRLTTRMRPLERTDCSEILEQLKTILKAGNYIITHDPLPQVWADSKQLYQLFYHLIINAIKFSNKTPTIIHIHAKKQRDDYLFSIQDNGIGIDPQYHERIFQIFQKLHSSKEYPGTGIGLAICKKIIEQHKGKIWVESKPGTGSTFFFTLPIDWDEI